MRRALHLMPATSDALIVHRARDPDLVGEGVMNEGEFAPAGFGLAGVPCTEGDEMADIKGMFTPEFRNRLDAMVSFKALDQDIILRVVDKLLLQAGEPVDREEG